MVLSLGNLTDNRGNMDFYETYRFGETRSFEEPITKILGSAGDAKLVLKPIRGKGNCQHISARGSYRYR